MKRALIAAVAMFVANAPRAEDRATTLNAIHALENPGNVQRPGLRGELGAYQFREMTWRMHTTMPFARAVNRRESDAVAVLHYEWLKRGLQRAGMPATPYMIALAWNSGLFAAISGQSPGRAHDYAKRATNLVAESSRAGGAR